jgi:signal transduction histidine kinase
VQVEVRAVETFADLLFAVDSDDAQGSFYDRLCEAACRLAEMDRAAVFLYDSLERRVRVVGSHGIGIDEFRDVHLRVDSAPMALKALSEDRVLEATEGFDELLPPEYVRFLDRTRLVCTPIAAAGRWPGVLLTDRALDRPLSDGERHLLWSFGKIAALAASARLATRELEHARQLQERIDLAREIHEGVIQRLFGVTMAFAADVELSQEARERITAELRAALLDLRRALQRPLGRMAPETHTTFLEEVHRLQRNHPELGVVLAPGTERAGVPHGLEPLTQSVLAEAVRNAIKHAHPTRVEIAARQAEGAWMLEITNDGVAHRPRPRPTGMGLRLAAIEALQAGGLVDYGEREPGVWRVRLAVPHDRP